MAVGREFLTDAPLEKLVNGQYTSTMVDGRYVSP
jgi:hypothetical protein